MVFEAPAGELAVGDARTVWVEEATGAEQAVVIESDLDGNGVAELVVGAPVYGPGFRGATCADSQHHRHAATWRSHIRSSESPPARRAGGPLGSGSDCGLQVG